MREIFFYLDWSLLGLLIALSTPFTIAAGVRRFGSLGQFLDATRSIFRTPRQVLGDAAKKSLQFFPVGSSEPTNPSAEARVFWLVYWFVILAMYTIVRNITRS